MQDVSGLTAMMMAAKSGCMEAIQLLLPMEQKLKAKNFLNPLMMAVTCKQVEAAKFLK